MITIYLNRPDKYYNIDKGKPDQRGQMEIERVGPKHTIFIDQLPSSKAISLILPLICYSYWFTFLLFLFPTKASESLSIFEGLGLQIDKRFIPFSQVKLVAIIEGQIGFRIRPYLLIETIDGELLAILKVFVFYCTHV